MKRLFSLALALVLVMCMASAACAETLSPRVPYVIRLTTVIGQVPVDIPEQTLMASTMADSAMNAAKAHVEAVRDARPKRCIYGSEIVNMVEDYKFFACAPVEVNGYTVEEGDMLVTLTSPYANYVEKGQPVVMVVCVPNGSDYTYTPVVGEGLGENKAQFVMPADLAATLPADGTLLDFFAK